ncbi:MAG: AraC family transcriptional regulator [Bacteroidota bacterium]|nr:AraC family transcriptional regulator [Bacteroidota bacterium]
MEPTWGITILHAGHNVHPPQNTYPDQYLHPPNYYFGWEKGRVLEEFQLVFIAAGSGIFEAEHVGRVVIESGTVFLLFPGVWHRYRPAVDTGWEEYWVGFKGSFADHLMSQECFRYDAPLIHVGFNIELLNIFIRLMDTLKFEGTAFSQIASCQTIQLLGLVYASALLKEKCNNRKVNIINNIKYKIHEQWASSFEMEELAIQQHVSYAWLRKAFKEITGISPGQYLLNIKIEKASQMLGETDLSIAEVAAAAGFLSDHHFSRYFKKKMKVSPSKYREQKQHR